MDYLLNFNIYRFFLVLVSTDLPFPVLIVKIIKKNQHMKVFPEGPYNVDSLIKGSK